MNFKKAFTLSEVMLVLSVIGVIAALTIPGLIQSTQNKQIVTQLKKDYSVLSQAFTAIAADNDGDIASIFTGSESADDANAMNVFAPKLNIIKNCGTGMGCWYDTTRKFLNGVSANAKFDTDLNTHYGKAIFADGSMLFVDIWDPKCTADYGVGPIHNSVCGSFEIDVNGAKGPNMAGRDYFVFWLTKYGVFPAGLNSDGRTCDTTKADWVQNYGCTAKVLQEGAINY